MKNYLVALICCLFVNVMFADSWIDPSWKKILERSDLIALVEYTSKGDFRAKAKILKIYKGTATTDAIWIGGFSNRYGPIDTVKPGDQFVVFLNKARTFTEDSEAYWKRRVKEKPKLKKYVAALKKGIVYFVQTPTSGDLKVAKDKVQYDLLTSSFYKSQRFYDLKAFEEFLFAYANDAEKFHKKIVQKLYKNLDSERTSQLLMMLYLTSYNRYENVLESIRKKNNSRSQFALAKLAENIQDVQGKELLIRLLDSEHSLAQGEAVRQLSKLDADFIGPILTAKLPEAGDGGVYPQNIMDPVRNSLDGGKIEIIKTLGKLKYKPAIPKLLPLLQTEDEFLFMTTFKTLQELETRDYIPYINAHLEAGTIDFMYELGRIIAKNQLTECIPSFIKYAKAQDKAVFPTKDFCISFFSGLGSFDLPEVKAFLTDDFKKLVQTPRTELNDNKDAWLSEYFQTFAHLKMTDIKPFVYKAMLEYYGFDDTFKQDASLFQKKQATEETLKKIVATLLQDAKITYDKIHITTLFDYATAVDLKTIPAIVQITMKGNHTKIEKRGEILLRSLKEQQYDGLCLTISSGSFTRVFNDKSILEFSDNLMWNFTKYLIKVPDAADIVFLQNLYDFGYCNSAYDKEDLAEKIQEAKANLKKN
jgi:hypothetical protein